ncbi:hypothetical protein [Hydrogenophaga sp.]|uniref:hypothetical protein n=1 Tax=Hydrogenophaga sp. TaxID=1904254 RepID=UPI0035B3425D
MTGINRFNVRDGEIRFGQYDGYVLTEGRLDARVAANTPVTDSHEKLAQTDRAMAQQAANQPAQAQVVEPLSTGAIQRAA